MKTQWKLFSETPEFEGAKLNSGRAVEVIGMTER